MNLQCEIYSTLDKDIISKDLIVAKKYLLQTKGRNKVKFIFKPIDTIKPKIVVDSSGDRRIDWDWFKETFKLGEGTNARCFLFSKKEQEVFNITKKLNGSYLNDKNDHIFDFWVSIDPGKGAKHYNFSEFLRVFLHELAHGDAHFLGLDQETIHIEDYKKHSIQHFFKTLDYSSWNKKYSEYTELKRKLNID